MTKKIFVISIILFGLLINGFSYIVHSAGTGSTSPTATGSYKNEWTNPTNAYTQNNVYATSTTATLTDEQDYYNFGFAITYFYAVLGIEVYIDGYASSTLCRYNIKLSWDAGVSWTAVKNSPNLGTSDTNTYVNTGSSTDTWGHTWTESQLSNANFRCYLQSYNTFSGRTIYTDHMYMVVTYSAYPSEPTNMKAISVACSKNVNLSWLGGLHNFDDLHDYTRIQRSTVTYPTNINSGTNICNITGLIYPYYIDTTTSYNTLYYYSSWCYNVTYNLWSTLYDTSEVRTPCECSACNSTVLTLYNNTQHTTGKYETVYNINTGWKIWLNYTGVLPVFNHYENILNATGTHAHNTMNNGYTINSWANYTGITTPIHTTDTKKNVTGSISYIINNTGYWITSTHESKTTLINNIVNATGTHNSLWNGINWVIWANYTGNTSSYQICNSTNISIIENLINCTGTCDAIYNNITGWLIYNNYTGNVSISNCTGIIWVNYSDINLSFNVSINKADNSNTSTYEINENNWLNLAGILLFDNSQVFLFLLVLLWTYFINKYYDTKRILFGYVQFGISIPLCIYVAIISLTFVFGFIVVFLIPIISLYILVDAIYFNKKK